MEQRIDAPAAGGGREGWCSVPTPEEQFRSLYAAEVVGLVGYAARRLSAPDDAADVVAEVFTVAWRRLAEVPTGAAARPWLYGVARGVLANHRRGAWRRDRLADRLRDELRVMAVSARPVDAEVHDLRAALGRMEPDDRELLLLTSWEGLSPAEIATAMELPAATVRSRLHRARRQLRRELSLVDTSPTGSGERCGGTGHVDGGRQSLAGEHEEYR